jgi:hypothetical protein
MKFDLTQDSYNMLGEYILIIKNNIILIILS